MQHPVHDDDIDGVAEEGEILLEAHPEIRARFDRIEAALAQGTYEGQTEASVRAIVDGHTGADAVEQ